MIHDKKTKVEAVKLYKSGKSSREVAELVGCTYESVLTWVRTAGVDTRPAGVSGYNKKIRVKAVKLYKSGKTSTEVAELVGVTRDSVLNWLFDAGVDVSLQVYDKKTRAEAVKLYKSGKTSTEVAELVGCTRDSVLRWARAAGVDIRSRGVAK